LLPEEAMVPGELEFVAVPMHRWFLECRSRVDPPRPSAATVRVGSQSIKPPTKIRHVVPVYPPAAIEARRQGIVILEAMISASGCVSQAKVLRSVATDLDLSALRTVTGWGYTPTLLNGTPVPVIMTMTVQFELQ
jgi:periplasmic protein TonB